MSWLALFYLAFTFAGGGVGAIMSARSPRTIKLISIVFCAVFWPLVALVLLRALIPEIGALLGRRI
ncbi:MAG: hypothetical protein AAFQ13_00665 [Pseudomonadota bacterium]